MPPNRNLIRQVKSPRKKINLARKKRATIEQSVWLISKRNNGKIYFLVDYDRDNKTALWSQHRRDALEFKTEAGVTQYISTYLNNRKDIILVHTAS